MTPFDMRCKLLNYMLTLGLDDERYSAFIRQNDLSLYSAVLHDKNYAVLNDNIKDLVNYTFEKWLEMIGVEDTGYENVYDIDPDLDLPPVLVANDE